MPNLGNFRFRSKTESGADKESAYERRRSQVRRAQRYIRHPIKLPSSRITSRRGRGPLQGYLGQCSRRKKAPWRPLRCKYVSLFANHLTDMGAPWILQEPPRAQGELHQSPRGRGG